MHDRGFNSGMHGKRLTLRRIREACSPKVFNRGREHYEQGKVSRISLQQDGTLKGIILSNHLHSIDVLDLKTSLMHMLKRPQKGNYTTVSLQTGKRHCLCLYSQVDICSHVAALLICAVKDLRATVPAGDLPMHRKSVTPTTLPYRKEADRILAQAASITSAKEDLDEFLKLATACDDEGDLTEAILVGLGVTEALLSGLDYQAYSGYFALPFAIPIGYVLPATREPEGADAMRVRKVGEVVYMIIRLLSRSRMSHEQKVPCIAALHRLFVMTHPWGPSRLYLFPLAILPRTDRDLEFLRRLYDPVVPERTPDWRKDPIGFRAVVELVRLQSNTYERLKDDSLLAFYERRHRDGFGMCIRYLTCLRSMKSPDLKAVEEEARRLFPDADFWKSFYNRR